MPSQFVTRENVALASGFSAAVPDVGAAHMPTATASAASATHGSQSCGASRGASGTVAAAVRQHFVDRVDLDPDVADVAQALLRILGETAEQQPANRTRASPAGSADQSGSRSRILAIESETVSPANATRPVSIS